MVSPTFAKGAEKGNKNVKTSEIKLIKAKKHYNISPPSDSTANQTPNFTSKIEGGLSTASTSRTQGNSLVFKFDSKSNTFLYNHSDFLSFRSRPLSKANVTERLDEINKLPCLAQKKPKFGIFLLIAILVVALLLLVLICAEVIVYSL